MRLALFVLLTSAVCCVLGDNIYASKIIRLQDLKIGTNTITFDTKSDFYVSSSQSLDAKAYESRITVYLAGTGVNLFDASSWKTANGDKKSLFSDISGSTLTIINNNTALPNYPNPAIIYGVSSAPLSMVYDAQQNTTITIRPITNYPSEYYVTILSTTGAMRLGNVVSKNGFYPQNVFAGGCQEANAPGYRLISSSDAPVGDYLMDISEYASTIRVSGNTGILSFSASSQSIAGTRNINMARKSTAVFTSQNYRMNRGQIQSQNSFVNYFCKQSTFTVLVTGDVPKDSFLSIATTDTTERITLMNMQNRQYSLQGDSLQLTYSQYNSNTTGVLVQIYCSGAKGLVSLLFVLLASKAVYESM